VLLWLSLMLNAPLKSFWISGDCFSTACQNQIEERTNENALAPEKT
jgi:hypothetical protein